ncbi:FAD binding domain-containing protein [Sarocladium implicatum]|nr:FAD binding domain-containing protein [Sarocladium implicatum]
MSAVEQKPIIVVGAGLVGLTLAQGLKKAGFTFQVFDRDPSLDARPAGWGITVHWSLPSLKACLPKELYDQIPSIQVDPDAGDQAHDFYRFLNLETGMNKYAMPSGHHYRLNRAKLRRLLSTDIPIQWGRKYESVEIKEDGVVVHFANGYSVEGSMLLGVDGKNSMVKRDLIGEEKARLNTLPVVLAGCTLRLSPKEMQPFRDVHPVIWQGCHPDSGYFVFFSMLSTPSSNGTIDSSNPVYEAQLNVSWVIEKNGPAPQTSAEQLAKIKEAACASTGMFPALRDALLAIPEDTHTQKLVLEDWPTQAWPLSDGRITLLGDAAHTMTMYRGEAANHGMYDAASFVHQLNLWRKGNKSRQDAFRDFQSEVVERTHEAVLLSRFACLECHDLEGLSDQSKVFQVSGFNARVKEEREVFDLTPEVVTTSA